MSATDHPIDFVFDPSVGFSGTADRMDLLPVGANLGKISTTRENFERPYLGNGSSDPLHLWF